ncbi:MAG: hypothetical protein ABIJ65_11825 [Chloroflexota bacterium]
MRSRFAVASGRYLPHGFERGLPRDRLEEQENHPLGHDLRIGRFRDPGRRRRGLKEQEVRRVRNSHANERVAVRAKQAGSHFSVNLGLFFQIKVDNTAKIPYYFNKQISGVSAIIQVTRSPNPA